MTHDPIAYQAWKQANPEKIQQRRDRQNAKNSQQRELRRAKTAAWRAANPLKVREMNSRLYSERRRSDPGFYWRTKLRICLNNELKAAALGVSKRFSDLIGCTIPDLRAHLENLFKPGMTWENRGIRGWQIDHVRPCCSFDLSDPEQRKICFHFTNLQPLWEKENQAKGSRVLV